MIADSVAFLVGEGKRVIYDAEHFFDAYRDDADYALRCLRAAAEAGAENVTLCDTNGSSLPGQVARGHGAGRRRARAACRWASTPTTTPAAASRTRSSASRAARALVQGTMNGYGERCGNANLVSILPALQLKLGFESIGRERLQRPDRDRPPGRRAAATSRRTPTSPTWARNAFAHKGGMHVAGVNADARTFEHLDPADVGADRRVLVSELSGKGTVQARARRGRRHGRREWSSA